MQNLKLKSFLLVGLLLLKWTAIHALTRLPEPNAPLQIRADKATIEQTSRQAIYLGNVILTQGSRVLHADKLEVKQDSQGRWDVIRATGNPARFTGNLDTNSQPVYGTAKTIYYYPDKQLVILEGGAVLEHEKDKFQGPTLSYEIDKRIISATKQSDERPTITIQPRAS